MNPLLMLWNLQKVAVKTFARFALEISMVLESAGGCCESIINVLESLEGCCEDICTFFIEISMVLESAGGCCESGNIAMSLFYILRCATPAALAVETTKG